MKKKSYSVSQDRDLYPVNEDAKNDTTKIMKSLESIGDPCETALMEKKSMNKIAEELVKMAKEMVADTFNVGDRVMLRHDVLSRHSRSVPPHAGFTTEEFAWRDTLDKLEGKVGVVDRVFPASKHLNVKFNGTLIGIDRTELVLVEEGRTAKEMVAEEIAGFDAAFRDFMDYCQKMRDDYYTKQFPNNPREHLDAMVGGRWIRIVTVQSHGGKSAWAFVDKTNGDVMKPAGWSAPAKHARANIFDRESWKKVGPYGPAYLR